MTTVTLIIVALAAALVASLLTYFAVNAAANRKSAADAAELAQAKAELKAAQDRLAEEKADAAARLEQEKTSHKEALDKIEATYKENLDSIKKEHQSSLDKLEQQQKDTLAATKTALEAENDKALKAREESLKKEAAETIKNVTGGLDKSIKDMQQAFEAQKESHTKEISAIKTKFEETAKNLGEQSEKIGNKAEKLADALRHGNKMQGNWGEMQLENIFQQEGLVEGRDYEREAYLRDEKGNVIKNNESGKKMRPDFILHFPDNTDVIVDAKMSINAYVDWYNAETEEEKADAARRNLQAIKDQIKGLAGKSYNEYVQDGHKSLPYVVMYVSNYGALVLAKQLEPGIVNSAFQQNVLITTEETIMPFLRLIHTAWITVDQVKNQEKIMKAAQTMIDRVGELVTANETVGKKLKDALDAHKTCSDKLSDRGKSIIVAANNVIKLGVSVNPKKRKVLGLDDPADELPLEAPAAAELPFDATDADELPSETPAPAELPLTDDADESVPDFDTDL